MTTMRDKVIAVLNGGLSAEREVSLASGQACYQALLRLGYRAVLIDAGRDLPQQLINQRVQVVFLSALHGHYGEDGCVQGLLEWMGIPYTGSSVLASALAMDKVHSKDLFMRAGLNVAPYSLVTVSCCQRQEEQVSLHGYPCVVKPINQGSSVGVSLVKDQTEYAAALQLAMQMTTKDKQSQVIVEQYIAGQEVQVAILDGNILGSVCVETPRAFYDYVAKYQSSDTRYLIPAPMALSEQAVLFQATQTAYRALGCSGVARVDFILDEKKRPFILEVNTLPGMTSHSLVPKIAQYAGVSFENLVEKILHGARLHI